MNTRDRVPGTSDLEQLAWAEISSTTTSTNLARQVWGFRFPGQLVPFGVCCGGLLLVAVDLSFLVNSTFFE